MTPTQGPRTGRTLLVATRLPFDLVERLDAMAARLSLPGLTVTRAEATRAAVTAGLAVLEQQTADRAELGAPPAAAPEQPAPKPPPAKRPAGKKGARRG